MTMVAEKLREARALIVEHGWGQSDYQNETGSLCTYGAINLAVTGSPYNDSDPRSKPVEELFKEAIGTRWIAMWNDTPGQTQTDVLAAFDKAIELAEAEGA